MAQHYLEEALGISRILEDRGMQALELHNLGEIARKGGQLDRAERFFRRALALRTEIGLGHSPADDLCGLARVAMDRGSLPQALAHIDRFLAHLAVNPTLNGTHHPAQDVLSAYRILKAAGDPRAVEVLSFGHNEVLRRAALITNETLRHSFIYNVHASRTIVEEFERMFPPGKPGPKI
jgi:hypothetical protein